MGRFDAVIESIKVRYGDLEKEMSVWLQQGFTLQTNVVQELYEKIQSHLAAIEYLRDYERWRPMIEQAGKMDKEESLELLAWLEKNCSRGYTTANKIRALLASIPAATPCLECSGTGIAEEQAGLARDPWNQPTCPECGGDGTQKEDDDAR